MLAQKEKLGENRKKEIVAYVKKYSDMNGYPPTIREIGRTVGLKSTASVQYYVSILIGEGRIHKGDTAVRTLVVDDSRDLIPITSEELRRIGYTLCNE